MKLYAYWRSTSSYASASASAASPASPTFTWCHNSMRPAASLSR
jgi:hypothetical protein